MQTSYTVTIQDNSDSSKPGANIVTMYATDADIGDYGVVRYMLTGGLQNQFVINNVTVS